MRMISEICGKKSKGSESKESESEKILWVYINVSDGIIDWM